MPKNQSPCCWDTASLPDRQRIYIYYLDYDQRFTTKQSAVLSIKKPRSLGSDLLSNITRFIFIAIIYLLANLAFPTGWSHANTEGTQEPSLDLVISATDLEINEGEESSFTVRLNRQPDTALTVRIEKTNDDITLSKTSLNFNAENWNTAQSVTVTAARDNDAEDDIDIITVSSTEIMGSKSVDIDVSDNYSPRISIPWLVRSLNVEEGQFLYIAASLSSQPVEPVTVTLSNTNDDIILGKKSLKFDTKNWNTHQVVSVTVSLDEDKLDEVDTITLSATDLESATIGVTIQDRPWPELLLSFAEIGAQGINEGSLKWIIVKLTRQPLASVAVSLSKTNSDITLSSSTLTFTRSNWNIEQRVSVSAAEDHDAANDTDTITLSAEGFSTKTIDVTVYDNDKINILFEPVPYGSHNGYKRQLDHQISEGLGWHGSLRLDRMPDSDISVLVQSNNSGVSIRKYGASRREHSKNFLLLQEIIGMSNKI